MSSVRETGTAIGAAWCQFRVDSNLIKGRSTEFRDAFASLGIQKVESYTAEVDCGKQVVTLD